MVASKEAYVVELWDLSGKEGGWNPHFLRPFSDWERVAGEVHRYNSREEGLS